MGWGFSWSDVTKTLKDPFEGIPVVGGALEAAYDMLPVDNVVRSGEEFAKGNWMGGLGNLGYAGLETAALFLPGAGSAALKGATTAGKVGRVARIAEGARNYKAALASAPVKTLAGSALKYARPDKASFLMGTAANYIGGKGPKPVSAKSIVSGLPKSSAANFRMVEEADKAKAKAAAPDAAERMAAYKKQQAAAAPDAAERMLAYKKGRGELGLPTGKITKYPGTPAAPAAPVPAAPAGNLEDNLVGLTTEQEVQFAKQQRELGRQYDLLAAEFEMRKGQGSQNALDEMALAGNVASGERQNMLTQLASLGMDNSMAPGMVGQQAIANTQVLKDADTKRNLASLLSQIESERTQAGSARQLGMANLEESAALQRIMNTIARQQQMYQELGNQ